MTSNKSHLETQGKDKLNSQFSLVLLLLVLYMVLVQLKTIQKSFPFLKQPVQLMPLGRAATKSATEELHMP